MDAGAGPILLFMAAFHIRKCLRALFVLAVIAAGWWTAIEVTQNLSALALLALLVFVSYGLRFAHQLGASAAAQRTEGRMRILMSREREDLEDELANEREVVAAFTNELQPHQADF